MNKEKILKDCIEQPQEKYLDVLNGLCELWAAEIKTWIAGELDNRIVYNVLIRWINAETKKEAMIKETSCESFDVAAFNILKHAFLVQLEKSSQFQFPT